MRSDGYDRSCKIELMTMMEFSDELMVEAITIHFGRSRAEETETNKPASVGARSRAPSCEVAYKASQRCLKLASSG